MSSIGTVLKEEIVRLSRKESRLLTDPTRKATTQMRRDIAALKRQVALLERQVATLSRKLLATTPAKVDASAKPPRFSAKGLSAQRSRAALSANDFGKLVGVSGQSIYNWEAEKARPRVEQIMKLAALRPLGKRELAKRLEQVAGANG